VRGGTGIAAGMALRCAGGDVPWQLSLRCTHASQQDVLSTPIHAQPRRGGKENSILPERGAFRLLYQTTLCALCDVETLPSSRQPALLPLLGDGFITCKLACSPGASRLYRGAARQRGNFFFCW